MSTNKLTDKQERFCKEYIIDLNATQAAIRAKYSEKSAEVLGFENLRKPSIQKRIQQLQQKADNKNIIPRERTLLEIARLAYSNPQNVFTPGGSLLPIKDIDEDTARSISSVKVRKTVNYEESTKDDKVMDDIVQIKFHDKPRSLDMAMKHLGEYNNELKLNLSATKKMKITLTGTK